MARNSSQALLDLEADNNSSFIESSLLVCKPKSEITKVSPKPSETKPNISSLPKSQFLGKVKDFLGVMEEANRKLQVEAKDKPMEYDIEALTGDESQYIEMDLMLGVADLHTPEAVAAAESAIIGRQPAIALAGSSSSSEEDTDDTSDDDDDDDDDCNDTDDEDDEENKKDSCSHKQSRHKPLEGESAHEMPKNSRRTKRPKIVELS